MEAGRQPQEIALCSITNIQALYWVEFMRYKDLQLHVYSRRLEDKPLPLPSCHLSSSAKPSEPPRENCRALILPILLHRVCAQTQPKFCLLEEFSFTSLHQNLDRSFDAADAPSVSVNHAAIFKLDLKCVYSVTIKL